MGDMSSGCGCCESAGTSIAKNIKYLYLFVVKLFKLVHDPQPVDGLLGEEPDMPKPCGLNFKDEVVERNGPSIFREWGEKLPFTACIFTFEIFVLPLRLLPLAGRKGFGPDGLRSGTNETVRTELFEFLKFSGIEQMVVELVEGIVLYW